MAILENQLERTLIDKLINMGYEYREDINTYEKMEANFRVQLNRLNKDKLGGVELSDSESRKVIDHLEGKSIYKSAKILRDKFALERDTGERVYMQFIDQEDYDNNYFQVAHQIRVNTNDINRRYDVTILINGLPLVQIELKRSGVDFNEAINQIDGYRLQSYTKLFHYIQIFIVSNSDITKYLSNTDEKNIQKLMAFYWTDNKNKRFNTLNDFTSDFLVKYRLLTMITKYTVITESDNKLMVMRPYQVYATEQLVEKALNTNAWGYVWHTTGSGKTFTSWKCANLIQKDSRIAKVFFLVDRQDLDYQTTNEFNKFEPGCVDRTENTRALKRYIRDHGQKLIVTTMQKLNNILKEYDNFKSGMVDGSDSTESRREQLDKMTFQAIEMLSNEKVIFIIDECHRSVFGSAQKLIRRTFANAQYFGFTGTPIFKENIGATGRTTAEMFTKGYSKMSSKQQLLALENSCIHRYLIKDAIADENVLGFSVEYIKTFDWNRNRMLKDSKVEDINKKEVFTNKSRMENIVEYILENHAAKTNNHKYTSMFAVQSIDDLVKYYDIFQSKIDDYGLREEKDGKQPFRIASIFTATAVDDTDGTDVDESKLEALERMVMGYNKTFGTNFKISGGFLNKGENSRRQYDIDICTRLKKLMTPQIDLLLVVNMHLTGFDAKMLNTLYVDKELDWHRLLQAFSRTNRIETKTKPFGNIVCFRNLRHEVNESLARFNDGHRNLDGIIVGKYSDYIKDLKIAIGKLREIAKNPADLSNLKSEEAKRKFVCAFRDIASQLIAIGTFTEFSWEAIGDTITEEEYNSYKSYYIDFYNESKNSTESDKVSILGEIDFMIELVETDKINFDYIMRLIANINFKDEQTKSTNIASINKELDRSNSPQLKSKIELIKKFLDDVVPTLKHGSKVITAYEAFVVKEKANEIKKCAKENNVDKAEVNKIVAEYEFSRKFNDEKVLQEVQKNTPGIFQAYGVVEAIKNAVSSIVEKFKN